MPLGFLFLVLLVGICLMFPSVAVALCGVALAVQIAVMVLRFAAGSRRRTEPATATPVKAPVFSVHVATHNEPPEMVIATLRALGRQDWSRDAYEVIVIDNNTADPALWRPVEAFCRRAGAPFAFLHRDGVKGAKAGALNIALDHSRTDASHIVTVDADYQVEPGFLTRAAEALASTGGDFVQFPQAYIGSEASARGVDTELKEYFCSSAPMADSVEAMLLTGTLCVISVEALRDSGGWSGATTTEDAELGLRLCQKGYSGRFIPRVVGTGYLPFSLRDLEKQRYRWSSGNLRTLMLHLPGLLAPNPRLSLRKRLAIASQLTAWLNFSLVPAAVLLAMLALGQGTALAVELACATILLSFADMIWRLAAVGDREGLGGGTLLLGLASRIALAPVSAQATFDGLVGVRSQFTVTNKNHANSAAQLPLSALILAVVSLATLPAALQAGPLVAMTVVAVALPLPAALVTDSALSTYLRLTTETSAQGIAS